MLRVQYKFSFEGGLLPQKWFWHVPFFY